MYSKSKINLPFLFICFFISFALLAQKHNLKFKTVRQSDGLINNSVISLLQDSYGFVWIGTHQGLQRYDGTNFKNFDYNEGDTIGLGSNYISVLLEDKTGNIWIGTANGLNRYLRETETIERINLNIKEEQNSIWIWDILQDKLDDDILYLSIHGTGLVKFNNKNFSIKTYIISEDKSSNFSYYLLQHPQKDNIIYLGSSELKIFDTGTNEFNTKIKLKQNSSPPNNLINDIAVDPANSDILWLATGDLWAQGNLGGLFRYDARKGTAKQFKSENFTEIHILKLLFQDKDNLWIGTRGNAAALYNKEENKFYNYVKDDNEDSFGIRTAVRSIMMDNSSSIWFGGWEENLTIYKSTSSKFLHFENESHDINGLSDNNVSCFTEDEDGNIWLGTENGGINKFNVNTKLFTHFFPELANNNQDNSNWITALYYDSRKNLWIGTFGKGLYRYDPKLKTKIHYPIGLKENEVSKKRITAIKELRDGSILFSTYGGGLNIYHYGTNKFEHYLNDPRDSTSLPDNFIWTVFEGKDGLIYFAGNNTKGIIRFNPNDKIFKRLDFPTATFTDVLESSNGLFYVNDISSGLNSVFIGDTIKVELVKTLDGKPIKNVEKILEDSNGNLWLSTSNGILKYNIKNKSVKRFGVSEGLQGFEFNRLSGYKSINGKMYFGGENGFNVFSPQEIRESQFHPNIVFTDFKLFDKSVTIGKTSVLKKSLLVSEKIDLEYNQNDFAITYSALDFNNPTKILYKYKLENHSLNWSNPSNNKTANFTNLDPGKFVFKVLATNSDGVWLKKPKTLTIIIHPPIWETTTAYILYGLLFIGGIFIVDRVQRKRLIAKERISAQIKEAEFRAQIAEKENLRKSKELEEARQLQLSMLPKELPQLPHIDIAVYMKTATEVGGDYYDYHIHMDGTLTVIMGDATGHGMQSGMMVSILKSLFMSDKQNKDIQPFFANTNNALKDMNLGRLMMALSCVQINNNIMKTAIAGMPPILYYNNRTGSVEEMNINSMPLGAMRTSKYNIIERQLSSGDTILMMSDGFAELKNNNDEMIGYQKTRNIFENAVKKSPEEIVDYFKDYQLSWTNGKDPDDDVTFVVIKIK
ncbi:MAG: SpoIIE family protein phosphatase [Ignavibacteriales bacterium]|nr:SpoIIE family protein phosphatase [Ignavibacteriales bacterium]